MGIFIAPNAQTNTLHRMLLMVSWLSIVASAVYVIYYFPQLPERMPIHFNASGEPDGWGSRGAVFILPLVNFFTCGLMTFVVRQEHMQLNIPYKITEENKEAHYFLARRLLYVLMAVCAVFMSLMTVDTVAMAVQGADRMNNLSVIGLLVGIAVTMVWYFVAAARVK